MDDMKLKISDAFEEFRQQIGIPIKKIGQTINEPDDVTIIDLNKVQRELLGYAEGKTLILSIYLKRYSNTKGDYYILSVAHSLPDGTKYVVGAYKIYPQIIPRIEEMTPIEILQEFIDIFGIEQSIAGQSRKLFYGELIQQLSNINDSQLTPFIHPKEGHKVLQTNYIKTDSKTNQAFCGLAYCIDYTSYIELLKTL